MIHNDSSNTILIADDQPDSLNMLITFLESEGYSLMAAQSGQAALEQARRYPPDLILLDVIMPGGIDGYETCRRLKKDPRTCDIPVIFLTVLDESLDKVKGFDAGGVDFIAKPADHAEVLARVHAHLHIRQLQQALQSKYEQCRSLTDAMFDGVMIHDRIHIAEVNRTMSDLFAFVREEFLTMAITDLFAPDARSEIKESISTDETPVEIVGQKKDKTRFPLEMRTKPVIWQDKNMYVSVIRDLSRRRTLEQESLMLRAGLKDRYRFGKIIGKSSVMQELYELIVQAAGCDASVLLLGESGSGKEIAARTIHEQSSRSSRAFVAVNCAAISDDLFEREFFGHRKGAFTGANCDKPGFFDAAQGGTLFLDEIGELTPAMQAALLRAIENHEYIPVGSVQVKHSDVRIIASTHQNLQELIRIGKFRQDFYYRIDMLTFTIPPLRKRKEDIPLLVDHFLETYGKGGNIRHIPDEIRHILYRSDWLGNVRELYHALERYLITGRLNLNQFPTPDSEPEAVVFLTPVRQDMPLEKAVEQVEKELILKALTHNLWKKTETAQQLKINRKTLYDKMKKHHIAQKEFL